MESPRLEISAPDSPPHQVALNDPALTIGRHRSNRLVIPDERASRFHCVVEHTPEGFRLRDLHSKNGTKLNGERITAAFLKVGDSFRIGKTIFAFSVPEGYQLPPPPHPPKPDPAYAKKLSSGSRAGELRAEGSRASAALKSQSKQQSKLDDDVIPLPVGSTPPIPGPDTPVPAIAPARASHAAAGISFAQPMGDIAPTPSPRAPALPPPTHTPAPVFQTPAAQPRAAQALPSTLDSPAPANTAQISPAILSTVIENLRLFAHFENDANPDSMLGESHVMLADSSYPATPLPQSHPNDPAAQPLRLFRHIALAALRARASHVFIEPRASGLMVRVRVDGSLIEVTQLPKNVSDPLVSALRTLTKLAGQTLAAQRANASQEGRFRLVLPDRLIECRLTITPSLQGATLAIRLADPAAIPQTLPDLCLPLATTRQLASTMRLPSGLVLASGPAGSGVTTTLYAALRQLDLRQLHVITIESQIDTPMDGVTQVPYDDTQPATLGPMIRVALKQSPTAILVGDIPDTDAARAIMDAADQGYLVLAGIHARDPISSIARLLDLGVPASMLAANLKLVVTQRLVRLLCPHCKSPASPTPAHKQRLEAVGANSATPFQAKGCNRCFGTGYMLRRPVASSIAVDEVSRSGIERCEKTADLRALFTPSAATSTSTPTSLRTATDELVAQGLTSFDEADRALT